MPTTMKSYRMSEWALQNLQDLKDENPGMSDADVIAHALALAVQVKEAWNSSYHMISLGAFELNDDRQSVHLNRIIWGEE